ncbi:MFS transporter [Sphaerotilus microaerophilus]|uniref:MFS transporter n=1 Tax=Sphaerotilus microaerophilus TaxID=2914710 RepID=A0ABM7YM63_9BURK|nr:MFS transporter [Sphaerotilus sp. FB-5]BDI05551.1 MFS transporter [Sphaerotilus sp. FB-5]
MTGALARVPGRTLAALVTAQICLHAAMSGLRLALPLMLLRQGPTPWWSAEAVAGVMLGLFALAPVALALPAGRWVDRRGYHRPVHASVAMVLLAGLLALPSVWLQGGWQLLWLVPAATLAGTGCNVGLIAMQRTAGQLVQRAAQAADDADPAELRRVFSWLGLAPALSNVIGPVLVGLLIDAQGFALAYAVMAVLPLLTLAWSRRIPREQRPVWSPSQAAALAAERHSPLGLLRLPGVASLLALNWFFSSSWDLHAFLVPLLGHERGLSASAIGSVLGLFAFAVSAVRLLIPLVARRWSERQVLTGSSIVVAACFVVYPWAQTAAAMAACALVLGLALGAVQPMIMTTLHHLAPPAQQGEAIALRSTVINLSSTLLPMGFGLIGAALGPSLLFRGMALLLLVGALPLVARLHAVSSQAGSSPGPQPPPR